MADLWSIISKNYVSVGQSASSLTSSSKYVNVDSRLYEGTWSGKYPDNKSFSLTVSQVDGFRAKVRYESGGTVQYQQVLIKDQAFRFGNTKFILQSQGTALIKNVVTDPASGSTYLDQAYAKQG